MAFTPICLATSIFVNVATNIFLQPLKMLRFYMIPRRTMTQLVGRSIYSPKQKPLLIECAVSVNRKDHVGSSVRFVRSFTVQTVNNRVSPSLMSVMRAISSEQAKTREPACLVTAHLRDVLLMNNAVSVSVQNVSRDRSISTLKNVAYFIFLFVTRDMLFDITSLNKNKYALIAKRIEFSSSSAFNVLQINFIVSNARKPMSRRNAIMEMSLLNA